MLKIGIICPSEIAFRRFMPALSKHKDINYVGVAVASKEEWFGNADVDDTQYNLIREGELQKADNFKNTYGGKIFESYHSMLTSGEIDAVYLPLPPSLHHKWAKIALQNKLHVFVEKPSTVCYEQTSELVELAQSKKLALHENYMFIYHSQLEEIAQVVKDGTIGDVRLVRIDFGFPNRGKDDFRYKKSLGGGALLDCGGYTFKYADYLLNGEAEVICADVGYKEGYEVELYGSATLRNKSGQVVQVSFGMDNDYRCSIDVWGSQATLKSNRVLTAPSGFSPSYEIHKNGNIETFEMSADDAFYKSIAEFKLCIEQETKRLQKYKEILKQETLVEQFAQLSGLRSNS